MRASLNDQGAFAAQFGADVLAYYESYYNVSFPLPKMGELLINKKTLYYILTTTSEYLCRKLAFISDKPDKFEFNIGSKTIRYGG